jgi:hypothetical protein
MSLYQAANNVVVHTAERVVTEDIAGLVLVGTRRAAQAADRSVRDGKAKAHAACNPPQNGPAHPDSLA